jgi:hypothetical protein
MSAFDIEWEWLPPPSADAFGAERATWAEVRLTLAATCLTAHTTHASEEGKHRLSQEVIGPLSGIADWLVENWLFLAWEIHTPFPKTLGDRAARVPTLRDAREGQIGDVEVPLLARWLHRHTLGHGASDLALPVISFLPEDRMIGVSVAPPSYHLKPTVNFAVQWPREPVWMGRDELLADLRNLVLETISRSRAHPESAQWAEWLEKRFREAEEAASSLNRRRELMFGQVLASIWDHTMQPLGEDADALVGVLTDSSIIAEESTATFLADTVRKALRPRTNPQAAWQLVRPAAGEHMLPPYERGYRLARRTRDFLKARSKPLVDLIGALSQLNVNVQPVSGPPLFRSAAVAGHEGQSTVLYIEDHPRFRGLAPTRFSIAAGLGRLLAEGAPTAAYGGALGSQSRVQATQQANAFAAELLLPLEALRETDDLTVLSEEYGISRVAAERHRENRLHKN